MGNYDDLIIDEKFKDYIDSLKSQLDGLNIGDIPLSSLMMNECDIPVMFMPKVMDLYNDIINSLKCGNDIDKLYILFGKRSMLGN